MPLDQDASFRLRTKTAAWALLLKILLLDFRLKRALVVTLTRRSPTTKGFGSHDNNRVKQMS